MLWPVMGLNSEPAELLAGAWLFFWVEVWDQKLGQGGARGQGSVFGRAAQCPAKWALCFWVASTGSTSGES